MTTRPDADTRIVLLPSRPLGRQAVTCRYRCGDACSHEPPNTSDNEYLGDVVARIVSRRGLFKVGAVVAAAVSIPIALTGSAAAARGPGGAGRALGFVPVTPNILDAVVVPPGYEHAVVIRWGDPIIPGAPSSTSPTRRRRPRPASSGTTISLRYSRSATATTGRCSWSTTNTPPSRTCSSATTRRTPPANRVETAWAAHGLSVVLVARDGSSGRLSPLQDPVNRRIVATTPMELTGPAAGSPLVQTSADPNGRVVLGTLNNCEGGVTPWGTVLSGEENFNN